MATPKTVIHAGPSEKVEAEWGYCAHHFPFTIFEMYEDEPVAVTGFNTFEQMKKELDLEYRNEETIVYILN